MRNTEAKLCTAEQQAARTEGCASWIETVQQSESKKAFHPVNVKVCFASASAPNLVILLLVLPKVVEVEEELVPPNFQLLSFSLKPNKYV
ncbi:unnamed protein product [Camellia sinensis]